MASKKTPKYEKGEFRTKISTGYCSLPVIGDTYRNCENQCLYCYERQANNQHLRKPRIHPRDYKSLFNSIYEVPWIKEWVINRGIPVRIGVVGEPFPTLEKRAHATYKLLRLLARAGISVQLTTKRPTDITDAHIEVLKQCPKAMVRVSFSTLDDKLASKIAPFAPRPSERLAALRRLSDAGIEVGVRLSPFIHTLKDMYDYEVLAATGATNLTVELFRFPGLWRHSTDPAWWGALFDEQVPQYDPADLKDKDSFIRQWAEKRERAFFEPLRSDGIPYYAPTNLWIMTDIYKLRELWQEVREKCHAVGLHFGICSMGVGIHNVDVTDPPCGCLTEGWAHDEGALVPAWHENQWADYLIPEIASQPYDAYLERIIIANSHTYRPIALDPEPDGFRTGSLDDEDSDDLGSTRGSYT